MRVKLPIAAFVLGALGCSDKDADTSSDESDADTDSDTDTDTDTDSCKPIKSGRWAAGGTAYGMSMYADVAVDAKACSFTFSNWNMGMSVPEGGTMDGTDIELTGSTFWSTCTGGAKSPTEAEGVCGGGETWMMELMD